MKEILITIAKFCFYLLYVIFGIACVVFWILNPEITLLCIFLILGDIYAFVCDYDDIRDSFEDMADLISDAADAIKDFIECHFSKNYK